MRTIIPTEEQKQAKKEIASFNRKYAGYKETLKTEIASFGVKAFQLKLEFLEHHQSTHLPKSFLTHEQTVTACKEALQEYQESLVNG